jgi:hypothetical protein
MKIYDSNEVSLIVAGLPIESGRGEEGGAFVKLSQVSNAFEDKVSLDGDVTRSKTNDNRYDVTVVLMSSSASNALLSALHTADKLAGNGAGVGPFLLKDRQGNTLYAAPSCWIQKMPDQEFGQTAVPVEWPIRVANMIPFIGGN